MDIEDKKALAVKFINRLFEELMENAATEGYVKNKIQQGDTIEISIRINPDSWKDSIAETV